MLIRRLLVIICPVLIFLGWELVFRNAEYIFYWLIVLFLILFLSLKYIVKAKIFSWDFYNLVILPFLLFVFTSGFLFLIDSENLKHAGAIILSLLIFVYLENVFLFFYNPQQYQPNSLENFSALLNILIFFLVSINLYAYSILLNLPFWLLSLVLFLTIVLLVMQSFWVNKIIPRFKYLYLLIIIVLIFEFFWSLSFLPTNFYVNSIILTIVYYLIWGVFRAKLIEQYTRKMLFRYLLISIILLIVIVITSSWV